MEVQKQLARYQADALYFEEHRQNLLKQHPDRWVAVYNQEVVGTAKSLERLISQLERKGIPKEKPFVEYIAEQETLLIL